MQETINKHIETNSKETSTSIPPSKDKTDGRLMWLLQRCKELDLTNKSYTLSANSDFREATKKR